MNKKLIATAIAAAFAAPMAASADATVYGAIDTAVTFNDLEGAGATVLDNTAVDTNDGALGIQGSEDLGNGLKAIYKIEWNFDSDDGNTANGAGGTSTSVAFTMDEVWVGLAGDFGVVAIGREDHPYKNVLNASGYNKFGDRLNDMDAMNDRVGAVGFRQLTASNALLYISPNISGFSGQVALVAPEGTGTAASTVKDGFDAYSLGVNYAGGGLRVGAAYEDIDVTTGKDASAWVLGASYAFGNFTVGGAYEEQEDVTIAGTLSDVETYGLGVTAAFGNNTVGLSYVSEEQENAATGAETADITGWGINANHALSNRTSVYASYRDAENDIAGGRAAGDEDQTFELGVVHSF